MVSTFNMYYVLVLTSFAPEKNCVKKRAGIALEKVAILFLSQFEILLITLKMS